MELTITKDKQELERLEAEMRQDQGAFYRFGSNLIRIRDLELYLLKNGGAYETFEAYCKGEWDISRPRAYQLIDAVQIKDNLSTMVDIQIKDNLSTMVDIQIKDNLSTMVDIQTVIEQNINDSAKSNCTMVQSGTIPERQLRPLSKLQPEQQRIAWQQAVDTAPDGKVTAAIVSRIVKRMTTPETAKPSPEKTSEKKAPTSETEDAMTVAEDIITQLSSRISAEDPKRKAAIEAVKKWCDDSLWKMFSFGPGEGQGIVRMMAENPSVKMVKI